VIRRHKGDELVQNRLFKKSDFMMASFVSSFEPITVVIIMRSVVESDLGMGLVEFRVKNYFQSDLGLVELLSQDRGRSHQ